MTEHRQKLTDDFVVACLREDYDTLTVDVARSRHPEDIKYERKLRRALERVLAYYGEGPL
jgi:hypothetical protein